MLRIAVCGAVPQNLLKEYMTLHPDVKIELFQTAADAALCAEMEGTFDGVILWDTVWQQGQDATKLKLFHALDCVCRMRVGCSQTVPITVRTKNGSVTLMAQDICYVEYANHTLYFHLTNNTVVQSVVMRTSFLQSVPLLFANEVFVRSHKAFLVNLAQVQKMTAHDFYMQCGRVVPIAQSNYAEIKRRYNYYLLNK